MDFCIPCVERLRRGNYTHRVFIDFSYTHCEDIAAKGGEFYAFWDDDKKAWIKDKRELIHKIDAILEAKKNDILKEEPEATVQVKYMSRSGSGAMESFNYFLKTMEQNESSFDSKVLFLSDPYLRDDFSTQRLSYDPTEGSIDAFTELLDKLYDPSEQMKILWFMGLLLTGNAEKVQKFMFIHGGKGTGKGTVIKIFKLLFENYYGHLNLKQLTSESEFATASVQDIPLLVDEDCDMSNIKNDTNLLKITAHEPVVINKKYALPYYLTFKGLVIAASNQAYRVRDIDSGIMRRAITVYPSNRTFDIDTYNSIMARIPFEIPAIAYEAIRVFNKMGIGYYNDYEDYDMAAKTDYFLDFMREKVEYFKQVEQEYSGYIPQVFVNTAYYDYLSDNGWSTAGYKKRVRVEADRYFLRSYTSKKIDGKKYRTVYEGLLLNKMFGTNGKESKAEDDAPFDIPEWLALKEQPSVFDRMCEEYPAQKANSKGTPTVAWSNCETVLKDIDTSILHYVLVPENHIVIDLDLRNGDGQKDIQKNLEYAAKHFPPTYAEVSKSGGGLHLHYIYDGDTSRLSSIYDDHVEIKVYRGKSSLRRKLTLCNYISVSHISTGLPLREDGDKVYSRLTDIVLEEKALKTLIARALRKEYHNNTTQNMHLIHDALKTAEANGVLYDIEEMRHDITLFAYGSTNQRDHCLALAKDICYSTIKPAESEESVIDKDIQFSNEYDPKRGIFPPDSKLEFFDVEVWPNLNFVVTKPYKKDFKVWLLPSPKDVEDILDVYLVGFNNRAYDNHILHAIRLGKTPYEVYEVSKSIVSKNKGNGFNGRYGPATEYSYADIFDYSSKKQSLKKWEIEMKCTYDEIEFDFNEPLPEEYWDRAIEYCKHDVEATEKLFEYIYSDYNARKILSSLSGQSVNTPSNTQVATILFGDDPHPELKFNYVDLSVEFPGYIFDIHGLDKSMYDDETVARKTATTKKWLPKSYYMGDDPGEGGYAYSKTGIYRDVALLDIASMHPSSLIIMNYFGEYTQTFADIKQARIYIKHGDLESAKTLFNGRLTPFLQDEKSAKNLAQALKIIINAVYGMTSAPFKNKFKHPKNVDNIVAKRGALFMIKLKSEVLNRGYEVAHIKTDSIKIPNADQEIIDFVCDFGKQYGYDFEHEETFKRLAITDKSCYIGERADGTWEAKGDKFLNPYVLKTLFTGEELTPEDFFMTKQVQSRLYFGEYDPTVPLDLSRFEFIGRLARVYASKTGTDLIRHDREKGTTAYVGGTKGYKWKMASEFNDFSDIDMEYYKNRALDVIKDINKVGPSAQIVTSDLPWVLSELTTF